MGSIKINAQQKQGTVLTVALREALYILEMPLPDLAGWLQEQIEQNPALQFEEKEPYEIPKGRPQNTLWIDNIPAPPQTLHSYLLAQAREVLSGDLKEMEKLIGNLDEKGFIDTSHPLLPLLQTFDPPGIGAKNLQHSLLLQLHRKGLQNSLAYQLIKNHYDDFIHSRPLPFPDLQSAIDVLSTLSLNPAAPFQSHTLVPQTPDIFIDTTGNITLNDTLLPKFTVDRSPALCRFIPSALWIEKMVSRRSSIIHSITKIVLDVQNDFIFSRTSDLHPLSYKQISEKLSIHESTVSRAVKDKVLSCPRGIYPLRFFFPHTSSDSISHHTAKERLKHLIERENKKNPLSDQDLSTALHAQGIPCARRTITKYRKSLKIPAAFQRKHL